MVRLIALLSLLLCWCQGAHAQAVLPAHPGPTTNGGGVGSALFFDLEPTTDLVLTGLTAATDAQPGANFTVRVYTRAGTGIGGPVDAGPGSSAAGWVLHGTVEATQGAGEVSLPIEFDPIPLAANRIVGVAVQFVDISQNYFGQATPPLLTYSDANLVLTTGSARSVPFTPTGTYFESRSLVGSILYRPADPVHPAHPGPSNNTGGVNSALLFDLQSNTGVIVNELVTGNQAPANGEFSLDIYTRSGTALGNVIGAGPGTSTDGWTLLGNAPAVQGEAGQLSRPIAVPDLHVPAGETVGVALVFRDAGARYFGTGTPPLLQYGTPALTLITGQAMSAPFTTGGSVFGSRSLVGSLGWRPVGEVLPADPGPTNNFGGLGYGMFMDIEALGPVRVTGLRVSSQVAPLGAFQVDVYTRSGTTLGGAAGPASSAAGWSLLAQIPAVQGATGRISLPIMIPPLDIAAGETVGVALVFPDAVPTYRGTGITAPSVFEDGTIRLVAGEVKQFPFTTVGGFFVSRQPVGDIYYIATDVIFSNGFQ